MIACMDAKEHTSGMQGLYIYVFVQHLHPYLGRETFVILGATRSGHIVVVQHLLSIISVFGCSLVQVKYL